MFMNACGIETQLAHAQFDTIRLYLLKCATRVEVSARRMFPSKDIFKRISNVFSRCGFSHRSSVPCRKGITGARGSLFKFWTLDVIFKRQDYRNTAIPDENSQTKTVYELLRLKGNLPT
jgi:hypothetical protein